MTMAVPVSAWWLHRRRVTTPKVSGGLLAVWNSLIVPNAKAAFWAEDPLWTPPGDGNPVSSWRDAGSENKPAVQATGTKQPDYVASVAALNNRPAIQGDGTDDFLQTAAWGSALAQPYYIFVVAGIDTLVGASYIFDSATSSQVVLTNLSSQWRLAAVTNIMGGTHDTDPHVFTCLLDGASSSLSVDGSGVASGNAGSNSLGGLTIASNFAGAGSLCNGGPTAVLAVIPAASLTAAQVTQIKQALGTHYGITVAA